jgi:DNA-binding transcriptional LysR family regulator
VSLAALDLNLLLVLDTVLTERSVARAAARLHVTPSAVSNALARLREALGDPLVTRKGRGIVPTPRAKELGPIIARALRDLDAAVHAGGFEPATTTRAFTLAIADVGQVVRVPRVASLLAAEMPRARLRIVGIESLVSLAGVGGTEVDVAVGIAEKAPGIHVEALFDEPTLLVGRAAHPAAEGKLTRRTLETLRHVAIDMVPGRGFRDMVGSAYARAGVTREVVMTVPTFTAAIAIIAETDYVATIPTSLLELYGERLGLRAVAGPVPEYEVAMQLSWHERTHTDPAMRAFRDLLRRALRSTHPRPKRPRPARGRSRG